jgi:hypothetical protein
MKSYAVVVVDAVIHGWGSEAPLEVLLEVHLDVGRDD